MNDDAVRVRVLIVDDHPIVRAGLRALLSTDGRLLVVGEAGDGREAVSLSAECAPDVVLMDLRMPHLDGAGATAQLLAAAPAVKVLVLTTYDGDTDIMRAVESGAVGYLLKDTPGEAIIGAVLAAARGETVLAPPIAAKLVSRLRGPELPALSPREVEVLQAVAQGLSNPEIATKLFIAETTVKTHLLRTFAKLDVDDRTRAVVVAMERGLLPAADRRRHL
ncbi:DNA-binding NarL/FixJ family response regulator [Arthrobacter pigmenti]|uniref:DNA-binding NarL/FixJ family response regulator n=1 Tax=Arthrobacter pigmenti TaxID=271432 RepID=A0A846RIZ1_9MICC|nr:response regulator transcription factor [Arthrobacter pigmenti]NJC23193.1 DNA-binding NarL/FixJ family response regulator [Arthrobacter pigmenti]